MINPKITVADLNNSNKNTLMEHLGIEYVEIGSNYVKARMPVDHRHHQPLGLLHGGASVVLAETLGSVAANLVVDSSKYYCVGLDINANHIKSVRSGSVFGVTSPIHIGKKTQVWEIKISTEHDEIVCVSRLTVAVIEKKS